MKSICFFSSYYEQPNIPYYVRCYLTELKKHFTTVVFITNNKEFSITDCDFLNEQKLEKLSVENEGFDFGMWHKAMQKFDVKTYERLALVNDSCILFKTLDQVFETINKSDWDYCGLLDSNQIEYHLQSYFVVINRNALPIVETYFQQHGLCKNFEDVIKIYEVGLTQHLIKSNLRVGSVFSCKVCGDDLNAAFSGIEALIKSDFPMIKKKVIFGNYRKGETRDLSRIDFNFNPNFYVQLIQKTNSNLILDFKMLREDYNYNVVNFKLRGIVLSSNFINTLKRLIR